MPRRALRAGPILPHWRTKTASAVLPASPWSARRFFGPCSSPPAGIPGWRRTNPPRCARPCSPGSCSPGRTAPAPEPGCPAGGAAAEVPAVWAWRPPSGTRPRRGCGRQDPIPRLRSWFPCSECLATCPPDSPAAGPRCGCPPAAGSCWSARREGEAPKSPPVSDIAWQFPSPLILGCHGLRSLSSRRHEAFQV